MKIHLFLLFLCSLSCTSQMDKNEKINGLSVVAAPKNITKANITSIVNTHANYAAIMPFGFCRSLQSPIINFNSDRQWFGERVDGVTQYISELHKHHIKTILKPQIWVMKGEFTGKITMTNETDWKTLEKTYSKFILTYAKVAQENNVSIYCIGTELKLFVQHRPAYWKSLIQNIKKIYTGKLTYAANWDEFPKTTFWKDLDYIGIDGYFPLTDTKTPQVSDLKKKWQKHKNLMKKYSNSLQKKILFTEFGYRSVDYTASKPWEVDYSKTSVNLEGQANATQALFDELWHEEWFAGGFIWKWFIDHENVGGIENPRFTPQNKPVEKIIQAHYKKHQ